MTPLARVGRGHVRALLVLSTIVVIPAWTAGAHQASADPHATTLRSHRDRTTWDSVFTAAQAGRGETTYKKLCARCHSETLAGGDEAVELTGSSFMGNWNGQSLADLHERIRTTMPSDTPGVYDRQQITDVIAYMLKFNGFPAGSAELTHANDALKGIKFVSQKP